MISQYSLPVITHCSDLLSKIMIHMDVILSVDDILFRVLKSRCSSYLMAGLLLTGKSRLADIIQAALLAVGLGSGRADFPSMQDKAVAEEVAFLGRYDLP